MVGHFNAPDTMAAVLRDGWPHTDDIGFVDTDGFAFLTERRT